MRAGWLTPDSLPTELKSCVISFPDNEEWHSLVRGALFLLSDEANWEEFGSLTVQQTADAFRDMLVRFFGDDCMILPVGAIIIWSGATLPTNYLLCNGAALSQATYPELFAVIGTQYGSGETGGQFNVPNLMGKVVVGVDVNQSEFNPRGHLGGSKTHTLTTGEMPAHTHVQDAHTHTQSAHTHVQDAHTHTQNSHNHLTASPIYTQDSVVKIQFDATGTNMGTATVPAATATNQNTTANNQNTTPTNQNTTPNNQNTGGGGSHNNLQPYNSLHYIIRYRA